MDRTSGMRAVGLGCMRLSTVDEARAHATIHAALDAGATWLDTAGTYGPTADGSGHNERLVTHALATWSGDRRRITLATKGGMTRARDAWIPDGRARPLRAACEASLRALGVDRIDLYFLHAPDPRTPLRTSARALAGLLRDGLVARVGLSNVTVAQLREAMAHVEVSAVQIELSLLHADGLRGGVPAFCIAHGIDVLAHRPLGGPARVHKIATEPVLADVARRHAVTPHEVALAWVCDLHPSFVPLLGASRPEHAQSLARVRGLAFDDVDRAALDRRFAAADLLRRPMAQRRPKSAKGDVVVMMGAPASGKSTAARALVRDGYVRLNRDELGGRLAGLVTRLDDALAHGTSRIVLDATWPTRAQRSAVIETAWRHGAPVRCVFFDPPQPRLAVNAVNRLLDRYGRLLDPDELAAHAKSDPHAFGPDALLRVKSRFEPPEDDEGFAAIDRPEAFVLAPAGTRRAVFVAGRWLRESLDLPLLVRLASDDAVVVAIEWWPEGDPDPIAEVGGVPIVTYACRHPGGPPRCWCRPPWPGLLVAACREHEIDPARSIFLGRSASDAALAAALAIPHAS